VWLLRSAICTAASADKRSGEQGIDLRAGGLPGRRDLGDVLADAVRDVIHAAVGRELSAAREQGGEREEGQAFHVGASTTAAGAGCRCHPFTSP